MSEMKINTLSVDLLQDSASITLFRQGVFLEGKSNVTAVNISVPIGSQGNQPEAELRRHAIAAARRTLEEAIRTLDGYAA